MSSAVVSTSAALGRHFIFDGETEPGMSSAAQGQRPQALSVASVLQSKINSQKSTIPLVAASRLEIRPAPETASSGISELDAMTGGLPRGCLTEVCGAASSGRMTILLAALAAANARGEFCAVVDAGDALDPHSASAAGVHLEQLLWVRCGDGPGNSASPPGHRGTEGKNSRKIRTHSQAPRSHRDDVAILDDVVILSEAKDLLQVRKASDAGGSLEHSSALRSKNQFQAGAFQSEQRLDRALRATDLLLDSGGFGLIVLDLADVPAQAARRIPLTTWFRFRRAVEHTPTILLAVERQAIAGSCSSLVLQLGSSAKSNCEGGGNSHTNLLTHLEITAEIVRSQRCSGGERKPASSAAFATKTAWTG
jgi:recombination protein RecA